MSINNELATIFYEMAELIGHDEPVFKARAYEKAAKIIEEMNEDIKEIDDPRSISGIGKGISSKIEEYIKTGEIDKHQKLIKKQKARDKKLLKDDIKDDDEIIKLIDVISDFHCHSHWNFKKDMIEKIVEKAQELGYKYIGISDHTKALGIERGLNEKELKEQGKYIKKFNQQFKILQGCEANILKDGSIDIEDEALARLDYVIAGAHSHLSISKDEMMARLTRAMENPHVDAISHPTNRIIGRRPESNLDMDEFFKIAKRTGTMLEINANPPRLDLDYKNIKKARASGIKMFIGTDAHRLGHMDFMKFGVVQARMGGCSKNDIINTWSLNKVVEFFKKAKTERF